MENESLNKLTCYARKFIFRVTTICVVTSCEAKFNMTFS